MGTFLWPCHALSLRPSPHQDLRFDAVYFSGSLTVSSTDPFTCVDFPMFNGIIMVLLSWIHAVLSHLSQLDSNGKDMRKYEKL